MNDWLNDTHSIPSGSFYGRSFLVKEFINASISELTINKLFY